MNTVHKRGWSRNRAVPVCSAAKGTTATQNKSVTCPACLQVLGQAHKEAGK